MNELELNGTHHLRVSADIVQSLGENVNTTKKSRNSIISY